jgi:hypothetical protein
LRRPCSWPIKVEEPAARWMRRGQCRRGGAVDAAGSARRWRGQCEGEGVSVDVVARLRKRR